ncbi:hypothetical protein FDE76_06580 [Clostridium botulinum]|uniref:Uncharacterized protein n=1 Tax=Clostridium botulinum (strain Eklund 17B / Type B) TaxID=935198 RepID=B2TID3_CLOBB|nr:conserved hypothetical protein [Clostridium botulinum B str. Eklund 17B (NRP)]MBY6977811.1 hypothetical protein [Clostridium botulinum]MBY7002453.1 hypothetical protein [Clostridium botulinum]MCR1275333.1 hypothetical protein [Clostridium botulinum]NFD70782.1 hypothetical protein [Clostridium botulinum]
MHKEVVIRKKAPVIAIVLLIITAMLYLYQGISILGIKNIRLVRFYNISIVFLTLSIIFFEIMKCRISYKYSIIANKLIINKIFHNNEKNLESINLADIVYLGKSNYIAKEYIVKNKGNYSCGIINKKKFCCIYKRENVYYKFSFNPSDKLIRRLNLNI